MEELTLLSLVLFLFLFVLAILWVLLPLAVFGIRSRVDRLIIEVIDLGRWQKTTFGVLKAIEKQLEKPNQAPKQPTQPTEPTESKSLEEQAAEIREGSRSRYEIDPTESG